MLHHDGDHHPVECLRKFADFLEVFYSDFKPISDRRDKAWYPIYLFSGIFGMLGSMLLLWKLQKSKAGTTAMVVMALQLVDTLLLTASTSAILWFKHHGGLEYKYQFQVVLLTQYLQVIVLYSDFLIGVQYLLSSITLTTRVDVNKVKAFIQIYAMVTLLTIAAIVIQQCHMSFRLISKI